MFIPTTFKRNFVYDVFDDVFPIEFSKKNTNRLLYTDIKESTETFFLELELPGYNKDDIKAEVKDGYLIVTASSTENKDEDDFGGKYIRKERSFGHCTRSFYIGEAITEKDITAKFENGILKFNIPKKEKQENVEEKKYVTING